MGSIGERRRRNRNYRRDSTTSHTQALGPFREFGLEIGSRKRGEATEHGREDQDEPGILGFRARA